MTFQIALNILNIEDYGKRIFNSHSSGELFYLTDYIIFAQCAQDTNQDMSWFRPMFIELVEQAEKTWDRPESIFQYIPQIIKDQITSY